MKKLIYIGMMCVFAIAAFAQEAEQIDLGPYGNLLVRTNKKPIEYYETQMKLWEKKVHQNKKDANAWLNYFAATKCAYQMELTKKWKELQTKPDSKLGMGLDMSKSEFKYETIAQEAFKVLPNTFEANYMMHFKDNFGIKRDYTYLLKANELKPFDKKILDALIRYYHLVNDIVNIKKTAFEIANSNLISTNEYNLAYNLLAELDDQAILLVTYHELVECIVLQQTKNIKPKVIITTKDIIAPANQDEFKYSDIVLARMGISRRIQEIVTSGRMKAIDNNFKESQRNYVQDVFNVNQPVYVSLNSINLFKDDFSNQLYLHGLTYRYSKQPANYIYNIKDNYEKNYSLDYIKHDISPAPSDNYDQSLYYMYYPSALKLYEFYKEKGLYLQQQEMKKFIQALAVKSGKDFFKNNEFIDKKIEYPFIAENIDFEKLDKSFQMYHTKSTGFVKGPDYIHMGKFEVTNGEFNLFLNNLKKTKNYELYYKYYPDTTLWNKNFAMAFHDPMTNMYNCHPAYSNYPIVNISYEAAVAYCEWLTEQHNKQFELKYPTFFSVRFRLPTEQEWRYAAGSKNEKAITPFPNDNILSCDPAITGKKKSKNETDTTEHCLYLGNIKTDKGYQADGGFHTTSVTSYLPNAFGIYNTFGNVAEMTSTKGIVKGGSWDDVFEDCTFDKNSKLSAPDSRVGFRMVMEIMEDINDMPTTKISPNLGVDKSEITHFYWEEFLNYQKQYYGENSPEYRDNLPDTTLVKKGECEHYNSESYNHPAYRNMPMIGITQQQAQNYTTWRTNRVFEWYLESNEYITRIENAPKSDFTVEKYYQNGLTDYTTNTVEKYPYVPVFSLPSNEDYKHIKQLAIANNKLNTKSKSVKMTFEIDSIALCNLKEINTYIDPKFKNIVYYLESGIAEWTSDSNKVINGSIEVNENHKKGAVTDANQLKYIGFRNKVEWKRWEGKIYPGPFNIIKKVEFARPTLLLYVKIDDNIYCLEREEIITNYWRYLKQLSHIYGSNSNEYKNALPDSTLWNLEKFQTFKNLQNLTNLKDTIIRQTFEIAFKTPLDKLTNSQLVNYLKFESDREFEYNLYINGYLKSLKNHNNAPHFTREAYYSGKLDSFCLREKFMFYPELSLPNDYQKQLVNEYTNKQIENFEYSPSNPNSINSLYINKTYYDKIIDKSKSVPDFQLKPGVKLSDIKPFNLWENYRFVMTWKPWNPNQTK